MSYGKSGEFYGVRGRSWSSDQQQEVSLFFVLQDTIYKIQETLFNVGYSKTVNISYQLFSDKHEYKNNSK